PAADEFCDGLDNDCSGAADDGLWPDGDGDGYGDSSPEPGPCFVSWIPLGGDCDDTDPAVFPGELERCNLANDGCRDGWTESDELGRVTWTDGASAEDWSGLFSAGRAERPVTIPLPADGALHICPAEEDWWVLLTATDPDGLQLIGHAIALEEGAEPSRPVLSGASAGTVLSVVGGELSVAGLQLSAAHGAGIDARNMASLSVEDCLIQSNIAVVSAGLGGAGAYLDAVDLAVFTDTTFAGNFAGDFPENPLSGGGLSIRDSSVTVQDSRFEKNYAYLSGGAIQLWSGTLWVEDTDFIDNWTNITGGDFAGEAGSTASFEEGRFSGSEAALGAALRVSGDVTLDDCTFTRPAASTFASVAYLDPGASLEAAGVAAREVSVPVENDCTGDLPRYPDVAVALVDDPVCDEIIFCAISTDTFECRDGACTKIDCQEPL
ncbi:MAG: hypothetical protein ACI8S6_004140, partial [Myxococcota bacterium]